MTFGLTPGKLGFKIGDVLVGLKSGTEDVPETIASDQNKLHVLGYVWNPDTLSYEVATSPSASGTYDLNLDEASSTVLYVGEAEPGTADSAAAWRIKRVTPTGVSWADAVSTFTKVWNSRASYTY